MDENTLALPLPDEAATGRLGQDLALALRPGDVVALSGDLGAGKTTLARALIRANAGDDDLDVPSPTFTLVQTYDGRIPLAHFDLYRLGAPAELDELGLDETLSENAVLMEWPEKAGPRLPSTAIMVKLAHDATRGATITAHREAFDRIARTLAIRAFLAKAGHGEADRAPFPGDASARAYELISSADESTLVLMDSPSLILGPPVRDGKPYAVIAHTARTVAAFLAVDAALAEGGVSVPKIRAADPQAGFVLMDHLGTENFLGSNRRPIVERYVAAAELLAMIHEKQWARRIEAAPGLMHDIPHFDREALMIEVDLLLDWYVPWQTGASVDEALRADFAAVWNALFDRLDSAETSIVLRDFHSPNIVWRGGRAGHDRLGVLDFQDALIGPSAYDVAALAMDARADVSPDIETATVAAYVAARQAGGDFDLEGFRAAYAITAAQRNTKVLGIFVRLAQRDGKPAYLAHLPRIRDYVHRAFAHPVLAPLASLYERYGLLSERA